MYGMVRLTISANGGPLYVRREDIMRVAGRDDGYTSVTVSERNALEPDKLRYFVVTETLDAVREAIEDSILGDLSFIVKQAEEHRLDKTDMAMGVFK